MAAHIHLLHQVGVGVVNGHKPTAARSSTDVQLARLAKARKEGWPGWSAVSRPWLCHIPRQPRHPSLLPHVAGILQPFLLEWRSVMFRMMGWETTVTASSLVCRAQESSCRFGGRRMKCTLPCLNPFLAR